MTRGRGALRLAAGLGLLAAGAAEFERGAPPAAADQSAILTGAAAQDDFRADRPGVQRLIRPNQLPEPFATPSAAMAWRVVARPDGVLPQAPPGFSVAPFVEGLSEPRTIAVAPNGDVFVAESNIGRIRVLRPAGDGSKADSETTYFATGLHHPYGLAFWPPGPAPTHLYVGDTDRVIRFAYTAGDRRARDPRPEIVVPGIPGGGHWTRALTFSADGKHLYVGIGSATNDAEELMRHPAQEGVDYDKAHGTLGAAWNLDEGRAAVLRFDADGGHRTIFATGLRNCSGAATRPGTEDIWCAVNERDGFGDNLPPDYVTHVREGAFYGWPWFYIGAHVDPRHEGERPDLAGRVTLPDVLLQAHSAPLGITFMTGSMFPAEWAGSAFVALQGSWNRAKRTGNKIIRIPIKDGVATGVYEDFVTGMAIDDEQVWAKPCGIAFMTDGSLLFGDEPTGTIRRVARRP